MGGSQGRAGHLHPRYRSGERQWNATDPLLTYFPIFNAYIASAFNPTTGAPVTPINISNSYSGVAPKPATTVCTGNGGAAFKAQSYAHQQPSNSLATS